MKAKRKTASKRGGSTPFSQNKKGRIPAKRKKPTAALCFRSNDIRLLAYVAGSTTRSFEGCAYTGGIMYPTLIIGRETVTGPVVVDLDSLRISSQKLPVLDDHDDSTDGLVGRTTSMLRVGDQLDVTGVIYTQKTRAQKLLSANDGGHSWQLSIGIDSFTIERVPAGQPCKVNNQTFTGPLTVVRGALCTDLSFVSVGGDDSTWALIAKRRARSKARLEAGQPKGIEMDFETWLKTNFPSVDAGKLSDTEKANYQTQFTASTASTEEDEIDDEDEEEEEEDELTEAEQEAALTAARAKKAKLKAGRSAAGTDGASTGGDIERAVSRAVKAATKASVKAARLEAARCAHIDAMANGNAELATKAKAEGWAVEKFELATLRAGRSNHSGAATKPETDEAQVMEAALLISTGYDQEKLGERFTEEVLNRAMAGRYRGFSLVECADRLIRQAGIHYEGARNQQAHMRACRQASERLEAAGFTTMTLSSILENAADKVLLDMYQSVETNWQKFCAIRSVNDFKIHSQYALDPQSVFQLVGSTGDFSNLKFGDRKYTLQASSYGTRFKIDFQTWRNDDLASINDRIGGVGQLGASTIEMVAHALLMAGINNTALFHSSNNNYDATSASTFGIAGLTFAETMWAKKVRQNGTPLGISPQTLLVGTALKTQSGQVWTSTKLNEVFTTNQTRTGPVASDNPFQGKYQPTVDPYFDNTLIKNTTGETATAIPHQDPAIWMLLARQGNLAPMHIGFLDGNQSPKIEVIQNQSEMVGFELAAGMHFGVGYGDPLLASAFNPNAA